MFRLSKEWVEESEEERFVKINDLRKESPLLATLDF